MYKIISVSNRSLCSTDFFDRITEIAQEGIPIILREKDLDTEEYRQLAKEVIKICPDVILHSFAEVARELGCRKIHLPLNILQKTDISSFDIVGSSVHSAKEALTAQKLGASYVTAGHVFVTDCKKGLAPRGLDFLEEVCGAVDIPVYAIGGINSKNAKSAVQKGASGVCIMSGLMQCENVQKYLSDYY